MNADKDQLDSLTERVLVPSLRLPTPWAPDSSRRSTSGHCLETRSLRHPGYRRASFTVTYKSHSVGEYFADLLVEDVLVVELKCAERLSSEHTAQCINYLRASGRTVCLLVNFNKPKSSGSVSSIGFRIPKLIDTPVKAE